MLELAIISVIGFALLFSSTLNQARAHDPKYRQVETYQPVRQQMKSWPWEI
jgi:hypothetical protein